MDLTRPQLFRWDELPEEPVTPQLSRRIVSGEKVMVAHIRLTKGCVVPRHEHEAEQLSYTISGALKFIINGETMVAHPGELVVIPSWVPHEAVALEDTYEMDVFSPIRHDWLNHTDGYFKNQPTQPDLVNPATRSNPATLYRWDQVGVEKVTDLIDRTYLMGDRSTIGEFFLRKGAIVPSHQHPAEQISWIESGHLRLTVGETDFEATAGSVLRIPSNLPHRAVAIEDSKVIDLFSPRRDDWLAQTDDYLRQGNR
jgi:quercetin dioxygenase-like cupin family protein